MHLRRFCHRLSCQQHFQRVQTDRAAVCILAKDAPCTTEDPAAAQPSPAKPSDRPLSICNTFRQASGAWWRCSHSGPTSGFVEGGLGAPQALGLPRLQVQHIHERAVALRAGPPALRNRGAGAFAWHVEDVLVAGE
jgi:hypothetical protein